jgi:hypothetical protein
LAFYYPGLLLTAFGFLLTIWLLPAERHIGALSLDVDTLTYSLFTLLIGVQITIFAIGAKVFGTREGFLPVNHSFESSLEKLSLERCLIFGALLLSLGFGLGIYAVARWHAIGFGQLNASSALRYTLPSATAITLGIETIFASFFLSQVDGHNQDLASWLAGDNALPCVEV